MLSIAILSQAIFPRMVYIPYCAQGGKKKKRIADEEKERASATDFGAQRQNREGVSEAKRRRGERQRSCRDFEPSAQNPRRRNEVSPTRRPSAEARGISPAGETSSCDSTRRRIADEEI